MLLVLSSPWMRMCSQMRRMLLSAFTAVVVPQDRTSFDGNRSIVLFLAESDPVCLVDVGGERPSAPGAALARPELVDDFGVASLWIAKKPWCDMS
jgi:hypothetical protein